MLYCPELVHDTQDQSLDNYNIESANDSLESLKSHTLALADLLSFLFPKGG